MDDCTSPERLTKWLAFVETPLDQIATDHLSFYKHLYPSLLAIYEAAGSPCGVSEAGMWSWWQERANRERAEWLASHRRMYASSADRFMYQ